MTDKLPEDWECLTCRKVVTDGEYDFCMNCLAKMVQHDLDNARYYWNQYKKYDLELNVRNIDAGGYDNKMAEALNRMPEYSKGYPKP